MNGVVVFIVALVAGIMGGCVVTLIIDGIHRDRILLDIEKIYKDIEKMDDNHAIDIADLHNDIEKTIWLDDLTIKGLQDQVNELKQTVDYYRLWSLGCWNDICRASDYMVEKADELNARLNGSKPDDIQGKVEPDPDEENQPTFNTCDNPDYVDESERKED